MTEEKTSRCRSSEGEKLHTEEISYRRGRHFSGRSLVKDEGPDRAQAIYFRMLAFGVIQRTGCPRLDSREDGKGAVLTHQALIDAAAVYPLSMMMAILRFELEGFLAKALELAEAEGHC